MRLQGFINEEDLIKTALAITEPVKTKTYTEGQVAKWIDTLTKAYSKLEKEIDGMKDDDPKMKLRQAQLSDIGDKGRKWQEASSEEETPTDTETDAASGEAPPEEE